MLAVLSAVLALASIDTGAAKKSSSTELERRACERQMRALAKSMGSSERASAKDIESCAAAFREVRAGYGMDEAQYTRWLHCQVESGAGIGGPCDKILSELTARKAASQIDAMLEEDERQERAALAALKPYRDKGLIGADTFRQIESASKDEQYGSLAEIFKDAVRLLQSDRVRPGSQLAIYPHKGMGPDGAPPSQTGERAADLAFVDARTGQRVVRFAHTSGLEVLLKLGNGELSNALAWVAEKPEARSIEVMLFTTEDYGAHMLLSADVMKEVTKLAEHLPGALAKRPLLIQGKTTISYERWLVLGKRFDERGFNGKHPDFNKLAKMVTLADLEKILR